MPFFPDNTLFSIETADQQLKKKGEKMTSLPSPSF